MKELSSEHNVQAVAWLLLIDLPRFTVYDWEMQRENVKKKKKCSAWPGKELELVRINSRVVSDKVAVTVKEMRAIKKKPHTLRWSKWKGTLKENSSSIY